MYKDIKRFKGDKNINYDTPILVHHYCDGPYLELRTDPNREFMIEFLEGYNVIYRNIVKGNMWSKLNKKYFTETTCKLYEKGNLIYESTYNAKGKNVLISINSNSLGDSLAWMPYAEEFRKKHECNVYLSTFMNDLFKDQYPEINFIEPGGRVDGLYAAYHIGWFYNENGEFDPNRNPDEFKAQPMQKSASDILGLDYVEIKPKIKIPDVAKKKKVGLGIHSTAQAKYWNNPTGWKEVSSYLKAKGYEVVIYSKEGDGYMGNKYPSDVSVFPPGPLKDLIEDMSTCEFFIGIGSGLSWLAWSLDIPVILISGFSDIYTEPLNGITRVINKQVCNSCFNRSRLDAADWNWCPDHKDTPRMFECSKKITAQDVINNIEKLNII